MKERNIARWTTALLSAGGFAVSWYLLEMHIQASVGQHIGGALCDSHSAFNCSATAQSQYSELFGMPIALLGMCFYAAIFVLAFFDRETTRDSTQPYRPAAIATTLFSMGALYSVFLAGVSAFELQSICPFCVMLYLVNALGLVAASMWSGAAPHKVVMHQIKEPAGFFNGWTGVAAMAAGFMLLAGTQVVNTTLTQRVGAQARAAQQQSDTEMPRLDEGRYRSATSPAKGPADAPVHLVVFSNFPCPYCAAFSSVLDQMVDEYGEELRVEYRHFPLPSQAEGHRAGRAAYCASEQDQFWPMHDLLFGAAPDHSAENIEALSTRLGLDTDALQQCIESDRARELVDRDIEVGQFLGIEGTPSFFLNGRRYDGALGSDLLRQMIDAELSPNP